MKALISFCFVFVSLLFSEIKVNKTLSDNDFEAYEFQLFVKNTKNIPITSEMTFKVVFEGDAEDYYENFNKLNQKRFQLSEEVAKRVFANSQSFGKAIYYNDVNSLQNMGVGIIGSIALNSVLGTFLADKTYVQVLDFFQDNKKITRVIKYLISDDSLDEEDYQLVFNTTHDESYHFRSGGIKTIGLKGQ